VLHGPSEIAKFVEEATRSSSDFRFEVVSVLTAGSNYANEWVVLGTVEEGPREIREFEILNPLGISGANLLVFPWRSPLPPGSSLSSSRREAAGLLNAGSFEAPGGQRRPGTTRWPAASGLSPETQSDESIDSNVRLPSQTHLEADRHAIADECPHTSSGRERTFARRKGAIEELLAGLKHSTAGHHEWSDPAWTAGRWRKHFPRHVARDHQVAVLCSVNIHKFGSDTDSREQIPSGGTRDQPFAHYSVVRESDPTSRKLHGGSRPNLRCGWVSHRCLEQDEREDDPFRNLSEDASVCHRTSLPVAA